MLEEDKETVKSQKITSKEIDACISILEQLIADTDQIFDIPKEKRTALLKASGMLSRPSREEFSRRKKDGKKAAKRKIAARDKLARKETGIRSAREADVFVAPKLLNPSTLANKEQLALQYTPQKEKLNQDIASLKSEVITKEAETNALYDTYIAEAEGTAGTKLLGKGPVYKEKRDKHDAALAELQELK